MKSNFLKECINKIFNLEEATNTFKARGSYKPPIRPGLTYWDVEDLQPFVDSISKYTNAENYHDLLDGKTNRLKKDISKKEKLSKKIQTTDFKQDAPVEGDDEYTEAPFKVLTPLYRKKGDKTGKKPRMKKNKFNSSAPFVSESEIKEDLAVWFGTKKKPKGSKQPKGPWVNICRKDKNGKHPPCGRPEADSKGYPKCRAAGVAGKMSDSQKRAACQQKRRAEKSNPKIGTGNKPKMVSYKPKKQNESVLKKMILEALKSK